VSKTSRRVVLLVQPPDDGLEMYLEFFRHHRVPALGVFNARDALAAAPGAAVIVTETRLQGGTDGVGLILQLRRNERTKDIPVIVLTTSAWQADRERCRQAGADVFLAKPCLPDALLREVRRLLASRRRSTRRAAAVRQGDGDSRSDHTVVAGNG
jgi:two-component system cell cycle response regulator DivK